MPNNIRKLFIIAFVIFLITPVVLLGVNYSNFDVKKFQKNEKRLPAPLPEIELSYNAASHFPQNFENYFNDHFGLRNEFISLWSKLNYQLSVSLNKDSVHIGKNGWLFLGDKYRQVFSRHSELFPENENIQKKLLVNQQNAEKWLARRGINFYQVIPPDKHSIYSDYLPGYLNSPTSSSYYDDFISLAKKTNLNVIGLSDALKYARKENQDLLYAKTDTHWSRLGASIGYFEIISQLKKDYPKLQPIPFSNWTKSSFSHFDLSTFLGVPLAGLVIKGGVPSDNEISVTDLSTGIQRVKKSDELYRRKVRVRTNNTHAPNNLNVLIFRDSFFTGLSSLFVNTFSNCIISHYDQAPKLFFKDLLKHKPDLVILERVERTLAGNILSFFPKNDRILSSEAKLLFPKLKTAFNTAMLPLSAKLTTAQLPAQTDSALLLRTEFVAPDSGNFFVAYGKQGQKFKAIQQRFKKGKNILFTEIPAGTYFDTLKIKYKASFKQIITAKVTGKKLLDSELRKLYLK